MEIKFFNTDIEEFIKKLDAQTTAKTLRTLDFKKTQKLPQRTIELAKNRLNSLD